MGRTVVGIQSCEKQRLGNKRDETHTAHFLIYSVMVARPSKGFLIRWIGKHAAVKVRFCLHCPFFKRSSSLVYKALVP